MIDEVIVDGKGCKMGGSWGLLGALVFTSCVKALYFGDFKVKSMADLVSVNAWCL